VPARASRLERLVYRWCALVVVTACAIGVFRLHQVGGAETLAELGRLVATSLLLVGKFVIFVGLHEDSAFSPWSLALVVWLIDLLIAFAMLSGLGTLEQAPVLGSWLRRARRRAQRVLVDYPGFERMAFFGVILYVMMPLAATGAVTGSFASRLTGLSRMTGVCAIAIGSLGTALTFAALAELMGEGAENLLHSPILIGAFVVALLAIGRLAYVRITRRLRDG
jgi:uncharacterized membrane protein